MSPTSRQPTIYKRWTVSQEKTRTQELPSNFTQTACSFFQTWGILFVFCVPWGKVMVEVQEWQCSSRIPLCCGHCLDAATSESRCAGEDGYYSAITGLVAMVTWNFRGLGPLLPWLHQAGGLDSGAQLSSHIAPLSSGDLDWGACCDPVDSGESHPGPVLALPMRPF